MGLEMLAAGSGWPTGRGSLRRPHFSPPSVSTSYSGFSGRRILSLAWVTASTSQLEITCENYISVKSASQAC